MEAPVHVTLMPTTTPAKRSLDLRDMMDELPMLEKLKDQKWMPRLPRTLFPKLKKSPRNVSDSSPRAGSDTDTMLLSPGFLPTPKTARAMSVLVPHTDDEILDALDARFFTQNFDPVAYVLENLPESKNELNAFMRTEISAVDVAKDFILSKLQDEVRANYNSLIQGVKVVQEVDLDLVRAQIHVKNGRRLLAIAKTDLVLSSLKVVKIKRNRDRVNEIVNLGSQIVHLFDEEEKMNLALQERQFITAVDICVNLRKGLASDELQGLTVLDDIRLRIQDFIPKLRELFDQSLRKVAEHFDPLEYKDVLQAYITLADHSENLGFEFSSYTLKDVLSNIPDVIVRCIDELKNEVMHQVFKAVSPKKRKEEKRPKFTVDNNGLMKSTDVGVPDSALIPATQTVEKIKRYYEHLTDLMHTYYLLVQWHRDSFNPHNDEMAYLHRCGIDDDDDDDDDDGDSDSDINVDDELDGHLSKLHNGSDLLKGPEPISPQPNTSGPGLFSSQRTLYDKVLCDTGMRLLRYRKIVWESIQQSVLDILEKIDVSYGFKMEQIVVLSLATTTFTEIGEEFTGVSSSRIRTALRVKCEQYLNVFHDDNVELTRVLLDSENWLRITTPLMDNDDKLGLLGLIEKRSGYYFKRKIGKDLASDPIYSRRVFPCFHAEGNPFSAINSMEWLSVKNGMRFHSDSKNGGRHFGDTQDPTLSLVESFEPEIVLTSSSLSGFVRLCGVYLKMMEKLPHISWDVFRSLNSLFEFNLYVVFTSFIAPDDMKGFLQGFHGILLINDAARWNVLRTAICRIAHEIHVGEVFLESSALIYPLGNSTNSMDQNQKSLVSSSVTLRKVARTPSVVEDTDEKNLYGLAQKSIACEAVVSQFRLLDAMEEIARSYLPDRFFCLLDEVYDRNRTMTRELRNFMYNTIATRLVDVPALLDAVLTVSWDILHVSDESNEYVARLVQKCGEVWGRLQILADGSIPIDAREEIWAAMVQIIMDSLLQAFSAVPKPTPQGRALMLLDLHALQTGLDLINHVSSRTVPRGCEYVNDYIKAFYFDENELLEWVEENKTRYSKIQFANLIKNGIGSTLEIKKLHDLVLQIDAIIS